MKRTIKALLLVSIIAILAACGKNDEPPLTEVEAPLPLEVELTVTETVDVGEAVEMVALVTQGDEKIEDADQVVYEIWEEGKKEESEMMDAVNEHDGTYTAETSFEADGLYHIQVHVDARGLHTMPVKTVTVGSGGEYDEVDEPDHAYHTAGFSMHFSKPDSLEAGKETEFVLQLELEGSPLEDARVRYEIWTEENGSNKEWVTAEESNAGEYVVAHTFEEAGLYQMVIHVEDDGELHEHENHVLEVK